MSANLEQQTISPQTTPTPAAGCGNPTHQRTLIWNISKLLFHVLAVRLFRFKAYGTEHIPRTGGVLLASTHQSYLDPILIAILLQRPVTYLASQYLFDVPVMGWLIRQVNAFPVQQGKGDRAAINTAIAALKDGRALAVYPEGHRTANGEIMQLHGGIALIARKAGVPIVPIVIDGAFAAWPRSTKLPRPHPVHLMYGEPIQTNGKDAGQIMAELQTRLHAMFQELQNRRSGSGWEQ